MHKVTCYGTLLVKHSSGAVEQEEYEALVFNIDLSSYPEEHKISQARSLIQNGLIIDALKAKYKNYKSVRECQVESITPVEAESSIDPEVQEMLSRATNLGCVPANYSTYKSDASRKRRLREALAAMDKKIEKEKAKQDGN